MSRLLTTITIPGAEHTNGLSHDGEETVEEMILSFRRMGEHMKKQADEILAASDEDFRVEIARGVYRRKGIIVLQEGRGGKS